MHLEEKMLKTQSFFEGKIISVSRDEVELENGNIATREVVHHSGGVCVIPIDSDGTVFMVRQFRYPMGKALLELPAGKLEKGESHYDCGLRELREEVGMSAGKYEYLGEIYPTPAYVSEKIHLYLALNLKQNTQNLDDGEFLDVVKMPLDEAVKLVLSGKICDSKTQIGILKAKLLL